MTETTIPRPTLARAMRRYVLVLLALALLSGLAIYGFIALKTFAGILSGVASLVLLGVTAVTAVDEAPWRELSTEELERLQSATRSDSVIAEMLREWMRSGGALRGADYSAAVKLKLRRERAFNENVERNSAIQHRSSVIDELRNGRFPK